MKKVNSKLFRQWLAAILFFLLIPLPTLAADSDSSSEKNTPGWRGFAMPFLFANSDDGLIFGGGLGLSHDPDIYLVTGMEFTTRGNNRFGLESEWRKPGATITAKGQIGRSKRYIYPSSEIDPEFDIESEFEAYELRLSYLIHHSATLEMGPSFWYENLKGINPLDKNGNSVRADDFPELTACYTVMAGYRTRFHTTKSTIRPLKGYILDLFALGGVSKSKLWGDVVGDFYSEALFATAIPLHKNIRTYIRIAGSFQPNTPTPLQNFIGGDDRLRGQPDRREYGNGVIWGRNELHFTLTRHFDWPQQVAHSIIDFFPTWPLEVELVPFHDYGMVYDWDREWGKTRHGLGGGIHFILPPELEARIDFAASPGGDLHYYFSIRQSL